MDIRSGESDTCSGGNNDKKVKIIMAPVPIEFSESEGKTSGRNPGAKSKAPKMRPSKSISNPRTLRTTQPEQLKLQSKNCITSKEVSATKKLAPPSKTFLHPDDIDWNGTGKLCTANSLSSTGVFSMLFPSSEQLNLPSKNCITSNEVGATKKLAPPSKTFLHPDDIDWNGTGQLCTADTLSSTGVLSMLFPSSKQLNSPCKNCTTSNEVGATKKRTPPSKTFLHPDDIDWKGTGKLCATDTLSSAGVFSSTEQLNSPSKNCITSNEVSATKKRAPPSKNFLHPFDIDWKGTVNTIPCRKTCDERASRLAEIDQPELKLVTVNTISCRKTCDEMASRLAEIDQPELKLVRGNTISCRKTCDEMASRLAEIDQPELKLLEILQRRLQGVQIEFMQKFQHIKLMSPEKLKNDFRFVMLVSANEQWKLTIKKNRETMEPVEKVKANTAEVLEQDSTHEMEQFLYLEKMCEEESYVTETIQKLKSDLKESKTKLEEATSKSRVDAATSKQEEKVYDDTSRIKIYSRAFRKVFRLNLNSRISRLQKRNKYVKDLRARLHDIRKEYRALEEREKSLKEAEGSTTEYNEKMSMLKHSMKDKQVEKEECKLQISEAYSEISEREEELEIHEELLKEYRRVFSLLEKNNISMCPRLQELCFQICKKDSKITVLSSQYWYRTERMQNMPSLSNKQIELNSYERINQLLSENIARNKKIFDDQEEKICSLKQQIILMDCTKAEKKLCRQKNKILELEDNYKCNEKLRKAQELKIEHMRAKIVQMKQRM